MLVVFGHACTTAGGVVKSSKISVEALVTFIKNPTGAMPKLHPDPLDEREVNAVETYVRTLRRP